MIDEIIQLTSEYGFYIYALMFIWAFFEGETFVIFSGVVASLGYLDASHIFLAAWLGSFCGRASKPRWISCAATTPASSFPSASSTACATSHRLQWV
jgi:hypothetical protein